MCMYLCLPIACCYCCCSSLVVNSFDDVQERERKRKGSETESRLDTNRFSLFIVFTFTDLEGTTTAHHSQKNNNSFERLEQIKIKFSAKRERMEEKRQRERERGNQIRN